MRALVLWADSQSANFGVRVLAQGSASLIRRCWGDDVEIVLQDSSGSDSGVPLQKREIFNDLGRQRGPVKELLRSFDLIWDTGAGDSFADIYGLGRIARMLYVQRMAIRQGIPLVFCPQTVGPFRNPVIRSAAAHNLRGAAAVFTRDSASSDYVEDLGAPVTATATDVVFALPRILRTVSRDVVVNVSGLLWKENPHVDAARYRQSIRSLITELTSQGREVSLLAHVVHNPTDDTDSHVVHELSAEFLVEGIEPSSLDDVREIVASSRLVIGSRMHACLNALSVGTPTLPWAYSRKFAPLFADLGWDGVIDLRTEADPVRRTLELLANGIANEERAASALADVDRRLGTVVDHLRRLEGVAQ